MKRFYISLLAILFSTMSFSMSINLANAEELEFSGKVYDFKWQSIPVVCGESEEVMRYLKDNDFVLTSMSVGKTGSSPDGEPVYFVTYYLNIEETESVSAITSPSGHETCMMYRSFNLEKPGDKV